MGRRKTQEEFLADLRRIHGDTITTVDRYVGYNNKMKFSCAKCGNTFKSIPGNITQGHGCPYCGGTKKLTQNGFLKKLAKVHGNKVTTSDRYITALTKISFHCTNCGHDWKTTPSHVLDGSGCPLCASSKISRALSSTQSQFLYKLSRVHGNLIATQDKYINAKTKMKFYCNKCGYVWSATPDSILRGQGCPGCKSSSGEQIVRAILEFNEIDYDPQYDFTIRGKIHRLDFVLKDNKSNWCVIQPDGVQHTWKYKQFIKDKKEAEQVFKDRVSRDKDENKYLPILGVRVLRIPWIWFDLDNIFILLQDFLGYNLKKPNKYYIPKYKNIKEMVYDYLEHGNIKNICSKYQVSYYSVINNFKSYFGMTRKEYAKLHPEYHIYWGSNSGSFKSISVCCIDGHGTCTRYPSISEASRKTGASYSSISNCIHGKQKTAGGYRWEYAN